jgi:hypothetical protein
MKKWGVLAAKAISGEKKDVAKFLGFRCGYEGKMGGWIYDKDGKVVTHGWLGLCLYFQRKGWISFVKFKDPEKGYERERFLINWKNIPQKFLIR